MKIKNNLASVVLFALIMSRSAFAGMDGSCGAGKYDSDMKSKKYSGNCGSTINKTKAKKLSGTCGSM